MVGLILKSKTMECSTADLVHLGKNGAISGENYIKTSHRLTRIVSSSRSG